MSLNIVLTPSRNDINILKFQVDAMVHFGGLESHRIIVLPAPSVASTAKEITEPLVAICRQFDLAPLDIEPEGGWPAACNQHFSAALTKLDTLRLDGSWLWMEPDLTPSQYDWANKLLTEHNEAKKAFTGHLRDTKEVMQGADGQHMVACGIYPPNFSSKTRLWQYTPSSQPFDVWLRWEIAPHCHDTKLIQHAPRTRDWEISEASGNKGTVCGTNKDNGQDWKKFELDKRAVLVHGCKDGSLSKLLCGYAKSDGETVKPMSGPIPDKQTYIKPGQMATEDDWEPINKAPKAEDYGEPLAERQVFTESRAPVEFTRTLELPEPDSENAQNIIFLAILGAIQGWEVKVPGYNQDATTGSPAQAMAILQAIMAVAPSEEAEPEQSQEEKDRDEVIKFISLSGKPYNAVDVVARGVNMTSEQISQMTMQVRPVIQLTEDFVCLTKHGQRRAKKLKFT